MVGWLVGGGLLMLGRTRYIGADLPQDPWVPWVPTVSKRQAWWRKPCFVVLVVLASIAAFIALMVGHTTIVARDPITGARVTPTDVWGNDYDVRMEHEANHARQWDVFGVGLFAISYLTGALADDVWHQNNPNSGVAQGCMNPFEWAAGLPQGGYSC